MKSCARPAAVLLITALLCPFRSWAAAEPSPEPTLAGRYLANGDKTQVVTVTRLARGLYAVAGKGWDGVGMLDGMVYWGVFRQAWGSDSSKTPSPRGTHRGLLRPDGTLAIHGDYASGLTGSFDVTWAPQAGPGVLVPPAPESDRLPELGEYVHVDELPEAVTKFPPEYPEDLRGRLDGTVLIQALVGKDGRVKDTRVIKSIPLLDEAAVAAVRKWVFKPAMSGGQPVAVWVAVPISFSLR